MIDPKQIFLRLAWIVALTIQAYFRRIYMELDCSQSSIFLSDCQDRALCVTRYGLHYECQIYFGGGAVWEEAPPPPRAIIPDTRPLVSFENQDGHR